MKKNMDVGETHDKRYLEMTESADQLMAEERQLMVKSTAAVKIKKSAERTDDERELKLADRMTQPLPEKTDDETKLKVSDTEDRKYAGKKHHRGIRRSSPHRNTNRHQPHPNTNQKPWH